MPESYNPIVRTFGQLRAGLLNSIEIDRHDIRPGTPLEALLPAPRRRQVWRHLQRQGLRLPGLERSERDSRRDALRLLRAVVSSTLYFPWWSAFLLAVPLALAVSWTSRRRAVYFPLGLRTVGELVIAATRFPEHKGSGYRWTRGEIELKVRLTLAESLGLPLDAIRPESTFAELGMA